MRTVRGNGKDRSPEANAAYMGNSSAAGQALSAGNGSPDFANYRRDGYDFDARYDDGPASRKDKTVYDTVADHGALLSKELKRFCNYVKGGNTGFDTVITRLQMQAYLTVGDFVYMQDKYGKPYGWGVAKYTTPEALFGYDFVTSAYGREQEESRARIIAHLESILPGVNEKQILKLIG